MKENDLQPSEEDEDGLVGDFVDSGAFLEGCIDKDVELDDKLIFVDSDNEAELLPTLMETETSLVADDECDIFIFLVVCLEEEELPLSVES